jgi:hypothetical protein
MSENEPFLSRWSRLKQETAKRDPASEPEAASASEPAREGKDARAPATVPQRQPAQEAFDPASLPPLDSIGATTDIRAFLARGVPAELTQAALRRAWAADPAVRNFIGLSENSWDFTAPEGVPGFGPMRPTDNVQELLAQVGRQGPRLDDAPAPAAESVRVPDGQAAEVPRATAASPVSGETPQGGTHKPVKTAGEPQEAADLSAVRQSANINNKNEDVAAQTANNDRELSAPGRRRSHGGALPS